MFGDWCLFRGGLRVQGLGLSLSREALLASGLTYGMAKTWFEDPKTPKRPL